MALSTVFDCFCGFGGLSLGAEQAGLTIVGGVDADEMAMKVFSQLFPKAKSIRCDLLEQKPSKIIREAGIVKGDIDVLIGGPPCQPFSINNHQRGVDDIRCGLVHRYLEFVSNIRPEWLVMENVPAFVSINGGKFFEDLLRSLRARGYFCDYAILDATKFGVPQRRRRLIVVAARELKKLSAKMKELRSFERPSVSVGEALFDLPELPSVDARYVSKARGVFQKAMREKAAQQIQGHIASGLSEKNLERIRHVPTGGNWRDIPRDLLPAGMKRARLSDHTTRYGRLNPAKPAFTLLTKCDPHWGCFVHPNQDRVITVREAARLQSIPDWVEFSGKLNSSYKMIGNAVPPLLAEGILRIII